MLLLISHKAKRFTIIEIVKMIEYTDIPEKSFSKFAVYIYPWITLKKKSSWTAKGSVSRLLLCVCVALCKCNEY